MSSSHRYAASSSSGGSGLHCAGSAVTRPVTAVRVMRADVVAARPATSAPAAESKKKWLPVATITRSTNGGERGARGRAGGGGAGGGGGGGGGRAGAARPAGGGGGGGG